MNPAAALHLTADRRRSTGESHQALHPLLSGPGQGLSIPAARHAEQARLEAEVFQRVCAMGGLSSHPLGIVRVRPQEDVLTLQLVDEPVVLGHWVEFLYPRVSDIRDAGEDPRDRVSGVPGLRSARVPGGVRLYRPGLKAAILLRGFSPDRWERIATKREGVYGSLLRRPDWTTVEEAAYDTQTARPRDPFWLMSSLLRRIRATAGAGPVNSTDVWTSGRGLRLETTDGPPCSDLVRLLTQGPCGLGWEVTAKTCTCRCDHPHTSTGCSVDFLDPATGQPVWYSNLKWNRTLDDNRVETLARLRSVLT
ncbi:hypothetical protein PUR25_01985 [Streptomyces sp. JV181]|uniref:hypothetical protein n=1 Tax=Streptomyces sp. JV181 TaxID=858635 RepID=UPI002E79DA35|nr:hypothetical protein [Streptomyces sp. JV181]MEE1774859.1 hypothetical protein [Streptomyces sp. JV181]